MMGDNKYYYIRLYKDFFSYETVDMLMGKGGADHVLLYLMLCLNTAKTCGRLVTEIGEVIIPYDVAKIVRDCKYFSEDTVRVAMEEFMALGLIYQQEDGVLAISNYQDIAGSESIWALYKRNERLDKELDNVQKLSNTEREKQIKTEIEKEKRKRKEPKEIENNKKTEIETNKERETYICEGSQNTPKKPQKSIYGEFKNVKLTDDEYRKLQERFPDYEQRIEKLSMYLASKGDKYKSHYATILNWERREVDTSKPKRDIYAELEAELGGKYDT